MPRYVLAGLVALALLPAPAQAQDLARSPAVRRQQPRPPAAVRARQDDNARSRASFSLGMVVVSPYDVYSGNIGLLQDSIRYGTRYLERTESSQGFLASVHWSTRTAGDMTFTVYRVEGFSTGEYTGIAAPETFHRGMQTTAFELGWRLRLVGGRAAAFHFQFGPSITLHRLDLSDGHRDWLAAPASETRPDIEWSDRSWLGLGGFAGPQLTVYLGRHAGLWAGATGRFYQADEGAWASQEERDIIDNTGRSIKIIYERLLTFSGSFQFGLEWRL